MNNNVEYIFDVGGEKYGVVTSDTIQQRRYSLTASKGFPWLTYLGSHGVAGSGVMTYAGYSKGDLFGRRFLFSTSPWWVDANHSHPGYGSLSLVFFAFLRPDHPKMKVIPVNPALCYPNMRNMKICGMIRGQDVDLKGADLVFWFQCYSEKIAKQVNYALVGQPLNDKVMDGKLNDFELNIDIGNKNDWVCLGSCDEKNNLYGFLNINELNCVKPLNMGFILVPVDAKPRWPDECNAISSMDLSMNLNWPIDTAFLPMGTIALYELEIDYFSQYGVVKLGSG